LYSWNPLEKLNISMGKYVLGVNKRTTNLAIYGELGRYPLYIDTIISTINKPTISEAYKSTGLTVWSNICIKFGA
jgi:hypothetical protein